MDRPLGDRECGTRLFNPSYNDPVYRIRALRDFGNVKKGDIGGYIHCEDNLSHDGNCWVYPDAIVANNCVVKDNAIVGGMAILIQNVKVEDDSGVCGYAMVSGTNDFGVTIKGRSKIGDHAVIQCDVIIKDSTILENSNICGDGDIVKITGSVIRDNARIRNNVEIEGSLIHGNAEISRNAIVINSMIGGYSRIGEEAYICNQGKESYLDIPEYTSYVTFSGFGSRLRNTTFYRTKDGNIRVMCGCFKGTIDAFRYRVKAVHDDNKHAYDYIMMADLAQHTLTVPNPPRKKMEIDNHTT